MEAVVMEPECTIVTGETGAGKSSWIAKFAMNYKRNLIVYKHYVNIYDKPFLFLPLKTMSNYRQGVKPGQFVKCKMSGRTKADFQTFLEWCDDNFRHGLVVIDDTIMFQRDRPSEKFLDFLVMKRHYAMNIFVVFHGLSAIPIEIFTYAQKIILFSTTDNPDYKVKKLPRYKELCKAIEQAKTNHSSNDDNIKYRPVILKLN